MLTYQFQLGQLSLSLGSIVAFAAAIWAAFWLARTIRLVLAEDLLPSLALPRGVGNSISTLTYYSVVCSWACWRRLRWPDCRSGNWRSSSARSASASVSDCRTW